MDLKKIIREEIEDFNWVEDSNDRPLHGVKFTTPLCRTCKPLTIVDEGGDYVNVELSDGSYSSYYRLTVEAFFENGTWIVVDDTNPR